MKLALVSGDGLPVSGLLTVFRNVVNLLPDPALLDLPIPADLGYSWRPDKPAFFPQGNDSIHYPPWLEVTRAVPIDHPDLSTELTGIRHAVARATTLDDTERRELWRLVETLAKPYERHFSAWLDQHDVDWVFALNMTLSDAVPVTLGLHRAAANHWNGGRRGGLLFWDHDLFASYSVHEEQERVYPQHPNEFTPLPGNHPFHRWAVVSPALAAEAQSYPTPLCPLMLPNVLPSVPMDGLEERHHSFLAQIGTDLKHPVVLAPVRVFRVKGLEISVRLLAEVRRSCERRGEPVPRLLIFGDLGEDPDYSREVMTAAAQAGVLDNVFFLGGVPLSSYQDRTGQWHLNEVDLLRVSAATDGGVFFTPNRPDVESVGLGPALAAVAGIPCAVTAFHAFDDIYGEDFRCVRISKFENLAAAAAAFTNEMAARRRGDRRFLNAAAMNRARVAERFPTEPWRDLLRELTTTANNDRPVFTGQ